MQKDKSPAETLQQEFTAGQMDERFNVIMSWTPYLLPSPVAVDLVLKCHKGSWDDVGRQRKKRGGEKEMQRSAAAHRKWALTYMWAHIPPLGWWRKGCGAERFLGALGRRVWSFCHRVLLSEHTHTHVVQNTHNNACVPTHERLMYDIMWQPALRAR